MAKTRHKVTRIGRYKVEDKTRVLGEDEELTLGELATYQRRAARAVLEVVPHVESEVIRYARKAAGLTQVELAGILEVTPETISRWDNGAEPFKRNVSLALAKILEIIDHHGVEVIRGLAESALPAKGEVVLKVGRAFRRPF